MKKIFATAFILLTAFFMAGCNQKMDINTRFSEITKIYYSGISNDGHMSASISVGQREEPYIVDGKHGKNCDFSLLIVKFDNAVYFNEITIDFFVDNQSQSVILEFNPINSTFMADLGYALQDGKNYSMTYSNYSLSFERTSDGFKVGYEDAVQMSINELVDQLSGYYNGNVFAGECYLKILSKSEDGVPNLYWIFTVIGENGNSNNVLIDIKDGEIILSNWQNSLNLIQKYCKFMANNVIIYLWKKFIKNKCNKKMQ